jgi:hypothetical protein
MSLVMPITSYRYENRAQMRLRVRKRSGTRELSNPAYKKRPGNLMTMPSFAISLHIQRPN